MQEKFDVAEPLLEQVLTLEPNFVEGLLCLSNCQAALGKTDDAIKTLQRVALMRPELHDWCEREMALLRHTSDAPSLINRYGP